MGFPGMTRSAPGFQVFRWAGSPTKWRRGNPTWWKLGRLLKKYARPILQRSCKRQHLCIMMDDRMDLLPPMDDASCRKRRYSESWPRRGWRLRKHRASATNVRRALVCVSGYARIHAHRHTRTHTRVSARDRAPVREDPWGLCCRAPSVLPYAMQAISTATGGATVPPHLRRRRRHRQEAMLRATTNLRHSRSYPNAVPRDGGA
jgi:hypothetical protein